MIEQLCYTRSSIGLSGTTEFQVRAASNGVADINGTRFAALDKYLRYTLPVGTERSLATTETSPYCLAYANAGNEYIVVHKVYSGRDSRGRPGVYFAHLLAGLPQNFSVRDAIDLWKSTFWLTTESELDPRSVRLPEISPATLEEKLRQERDEVTRYDLPSLKEEHLHFIIQSFVNPTASQKLYIAAPDAQTATLLWGLVHSLPLTILQGLTFSTYEHDLENATMRIVGTCRPLTSSEQPAPASQRDLPESVYTNASLGLNCYTNQYSPIDLQPELAPYVHYAVDCLTNGKQNELAEFITLAESLSIDGIEAFLLLYQWNAEENELSAEDITKILRHMELALYFLKKHNIQRTIINQAITNPIWWERDGERLITQLYTFYLRHSNHDTQLRLDAFAHTVISNLCKAIEEFRKDAVRGLSRLLDATHNPDYWMEVFNAIAPGIDSWSPSKKYSWKEREWFIQHWIHGIQTIPFEQITPWLGCSSIDELEQILTARIPHVWHVQAIAVLLLSPNVQPWLTRLVHNHYNVLKDALLYVWEQTAMPRNAWDFFLLMVEHSLPKERKIDLLATFLRAKEIFDQDALLQSANLSPDDIMYLLGTDFALEFLKRASIQQEIIDLASADHPWGKTGGFAAITQVFQQYRQRKDYPAQSMLNDFGIHVVEFVTYAMLKNSPEQKGLLNLLNAMPPIDSQNDYWLHLFRSLHHQGVVATPPWEPARVYTLHKRIWFLQCWTPCSHDIANQEIIPWLRNIAWEELEQVLSATLPDAWKVQAITTLLLSYHLPKSFIAVQLATDYCPFFKAALTSMAKQETQIAQIAMNFFIYTVRYAKPNTSIKIEMLAALLFVQRRNDIFNMENLLQTANLSESECVQFFKQYGQDFLLRSTNSTSARARDIVRIYVFSVEFDDIFEEETRKLLRLIREQPSLVQNQKTQERLFDWNYIENFISFEPDTIYETKNEYLQQLSDAIQRLHLEEQEGLRDRLFNFIMHTEWEKEANLHVAIQILSATFIRSNSKDPKKAYREFLKLIVEYMDAIADTLTRTVDLGEMIIPYITLSITYSADLKGHAKDNFIQPLFQIMLGMVDRKTFDLFDQKAQQWPEETRKGWQHYSAGLRPVSGWKRVVQSLSNPSTLFLRRTPEKTASTSGSTTKDTASLPAIHGQPEGDNITEKWVKHVMEVKGLYIEYRDNKIRNEVASKKPFPDSRLNYLYTEMDKIALLRTKRDAQDSQKEWSDSVKDDIHTDKLIDQYVQSLQSEGLDWAKWLEDTSRAEIESVFKDFKAYNQKAYRDLKKGIKEEEIKAILLIFIRYYSLASSLFEQPQPIKLDDELRHFQARNPS